MTRDEQIIARARTGETYESIGRSFGITRERVRQIARPVVGQRRGKSSYFDPTNAELVNAVKMGRPFFEIAERFGISPEVVRRAAIRHGWHKPATFKKWSSAEDAMIRANYNKRLTAEDIGTRLGRTKNAVIGRAQRMGLST